MMEFKPILQRARRRRHESFCCVNRCKRHKKEKKKKKRKWKKREREREGEREKKKSIEHKRTTQSGTKTLSKCFESRDSPRDRCSREGWEQISSILSYFLLHECIVLRTCLQSRWSVVANYLSNILHFDRDLSIYRVFVDEEKWGLNRWSRSTCFRPGSVRVSSSPEFEHVPQRRGRHRKQKAKGKNQWQPRLRLTSSRFAWTRSSMACLFASSRCRSSSLTSFLRCFVTTERDAVGRH